MYRNAGRLRNLMNHYCSRIKTAAIMASVAANMSANADRRGRATDARHSLFSQRLKMPESGPGMMEPTPARGAVQPFSLMTGRYCVPGGHTQMRSVDLITNRHWLFAKIYSTKPMK